MCAVGFVVGRLSNVGIVSTQAVACVFVCVWLRTRSASSYHDASMCTNYCTTHYPLLEAQKSVHGGAAGTGLGAVVRASLPTTTEAQIHVVVPSVALDRDKRTGSMMNWRVAGGNYAGTVPRLLLLVCTTNPDRSFDPHMLKNLAHACRF